MLRRVLVANRGEIAVRVLRTCDRLGIEGIAVFSDADADAPHVARAHDAVRIGPAPAAESYLDIDAIVEAALRTGADAVHPGYGFLSENPALPAALAEAGITFVGPRAEVIRLMGDKAAAKQAMTEAGVPVVPGIDDPDLSDEELLERLDEVGYPLLLKAVAGGGGKGMRAVHSPDDAADALAAARREARNAVGDDRMIVERLVADPRHVEVQVVGDTHGNVIHVLERECSVQRRHQKVIEEAPAHYLSDDVRRQLHEAGVAAAAAVDYTGAGTVEFLLDANGEDFYFLEMNTRLQVEHPVSELVTGLDLVELQLRVAAGEPLDVDQDAVVADGHAIEARLYAEDPAVGFLPQTGTVHRFTPTGVATGARTTRTDTGITDGSVVSPHYDPMLAKLVVHAVDRDTALQALRDHLTRTTVLGVRTNLEWLGDLVASDTVRAGEVTTDWLDGWDWTEPPVPAAALAAAAAAHLARGSRAVSPWDGLGPVRTGGSGAVVHLRDRDVEHRVEVRRTGDVWDVGVTDDLVSATVTALVARDLGDGRWHVAPSSERPVLLGEDEVPRDPVVVHVDGDTVWVRADGRTRPLQVVPATRHLDLGAAGGDTALESPMPGSVVTVEVAEGDAVTRGQTLLVVEAMKMEHPVTAPVDGTIVDLAVAAGDAVDAGQALVTVHPASTDADQDD